MRVYELSRPIGEAYASNPSHNPSDGLRVLYFMRRRGGKATDDQLQFVVPDSSRLQVVLSSLQRAKAINRVA